MDGRYFEKRRTNSSLHFRYRERALIAADAAVRHLRRKGSLNALDLGSAEGGTILEMLRYLPAGTQFAGVEFSPEFAAYAGNLSGDSRAIRIVFGDIANLPDSVKGESYDLITALAVLEHLEDPLAALKEAVSVLMKDGILIATVPHPRWDQLSVRLGLLEDHHETRKSGSEWISAFENAGLKVVEFRRFMFAPIGFLHYLRIPISPRLSLFLDNLIRRLRIFDWLFVNRLLVARKA